MNVALQATAKDPPPVAYRSVASVRSWVLPNPRPGWRGLPLAEVRIGQLASGAWIHGGGVCLPNGDGCAWPLGRWSDSTGPTFDSYQEAREAAFLRIVKRVDSLATRPAGCKESKAVRAWALMIGESTGQTDLFA